MQINCVHVDTVMTMIDTNPMTDKNHHQNFWTWYVMHDVYVYKINTESESSICMLPLVHLKA